MCETGTAFVELVEDNPTVRIVRYTLTEGSSTGWHRHDFDYVIVPYCDCRVRVDTADASVEAEMRRDLPYFREKGVRHNVTSLMQGQVSFLEIEIKRARGRHAEAQAEL